MKLKEEKEKEKKKHRIKERGAVSKREGRKKKEEGRDGYREVD